MTLGEFRKITEGYEDDCELFYARDMMSLSYASGITRVIIDVAEITDDAPKNIVDIIVV